MLNLRATSAIASLLLLVPLHARPLRAQELARGLPYVYPSAGQADVPRNAVFFHILAPNELVRAELDGVRLASEGEEGLPSFRFVSPELLEPGPHELIFSTGNDATIIPFEVEDRIAAAPDEVAVVTGASALRIVAPGSSMFAAQDLAQDVDAWLAEPGDCSPLVGEQAAPGSELARARYMGSERYVLEVQGAPLGFSIDELVFLPGACRRVFLPPLLPEQLSGQQPHSLRVVTEAGLGRSWQYAGDFEEYRPDARQAPGYIAPRSGRPDACSLHAGVGTPSPWRGLGGWIALLACALARRRGVMLGPGACSSDTSPSASPPSA